jgi:hypothetical protein
LRRSSYFPCARPVDGQAGSQSLAGDVAKRVPRLLEAAFVILALLEAILWFSVLSILEDRDV